MKLNKLSKALFASALTIVMGVSVIGCGKSPEEKPATTPGTTDVSQSGEKVEVDIFQFKVEISEALQKAADLYMSTHPNVTINLQTVGGGDDYGAALKAKFQSGQEPTIFNVGGPQDVADWIEKLEDLSDQNWVDRAGSTLGAVTSEGKVYGMPYGVEGYGLVYNKAIFEAAGIDASTIVDTASMDKAFAQLDAKIKAGELKEQFPLLEAVTEYPVKEKWVTGLHSSNIFINQEFKTGVDAYNAKEIAFEKSEDFKEYFDLMVKYSSHSDSPAKLNAVDYATQVGQGIAIERVAVTQQGNWVYGDVKNVDEQVAENLGFLPVGGDRIPLGVPMYWAINSTQPDAEKAAAKDFLNWLYTSDEGKNVVVNEFFFIPPFTGYENYPAQDALGKEIMRYQAEDKTTPWVFMGYPTAWGEDVLGINLQKYVAGEMTWEQVIDDAKAKWAEARQ
ncbi:sugar ABC transporter substrate-binding protein [Sporanaerobium hydrogeniformans]|uniref:Sugar ABC transporter substrate-binding protein n=1 Tax=Sporanaerobium hydrogeniformans TaxID=3072179 RepID=A0AC61DC55_9FIRM|nr:extracellular solute-binding protein [Sporanaerobium hydrogeniformans]PHV70313.1 sugar ABC transporter substrate-binding protein [Sporanaerobium hydrogeniformans]